jgi:hypothetical protein
MNVVGSDLLSAYYFLSLGFIPRSGIVGLHGSFSLGFLRNFYTIFYNGYTNLLPP